MKYKGLGRLNPIQFRTLKAAIRHEMESREEFTREEVAVYLDMMDRIGRDEISKFMFVASKLNNIEISEDSWKFAENAIEEHETEKKIRRGR